MLKTLLVTGALISTGAALLAATPAQAQSDPYGNPYSVFTERATPHGNIIKEQKIERNNYGDGGYFKDTQEEIKRDKQQPIFPKGQRQDSLFAPIDRGENSLGY